MTVEELAHQYKLSIAHATKILEFGQTGKKSEWQPCYSKLGRNRNEGVDPPLYVQFSDFVAGLHDFQKIPLKRIAEHIEKRCGKTLSEHTVRQGYKYAKMVRQQNGNHNADSDC